MDLPGNLTMRPSIISSFVSPRGRRTAGIASGAWSPPYGLPASGEASSIGTNNANAVKPAGASDTDWGYGLFNSYGGFTLAKDYSEGGALAIAGIGGHNAPGMSDAVLFDFADATWKRLPNTSAGATNPYHFYGPLQDFDLTNGATNTQDGWREMVGAGTTVPLPAHLYASLAYQSAANGGGTKGSLLQMGQWAVGLQPGRNGAIHKMDLSTGQWSRVVIDTRMQADNYFEKCAVLDEAAGRVYMSSEAMHVYGDIGYLRLSDGTMQVSAGFSAPSDWTSSGFHSMWHDPARNLILDYTPGQGLRALQTGNFGAGWTVLTTTGTALGEPTQMTYYPATGAFYGRKNSGAGNALSKLLPPGSSPLTNTWTWSTVTLTGATLPEYTNVGGNGSRHYTNLQYIPSIQRLAWLSGPSASVILCNPT